MDSLIKRRENGAPSATGRPNPDGRLSGVTLLNVPSANNIARLNSNTSRTYPRKQTIPLADSRSFGPVNQTFVRLFADPESSWLWRTTLSNITIARFFHPPATSTSQPSLLASAPARGILARITNCLLRAQHPESVSAALYLADAVHRRRASPSLASR